jgi:hypothetical protein
MSINEETLEFLASTPESTRLISACQTVSAEAFSIDDLKKVVSDRLPKLSAALKDAFRFVTTWDHSKPEVLNPNAVMATLRKVQYTDLDEFKIHKPVGFKGNLHAYTLHQLRNLELLNDIPTAVLTPVTTRFAYYLNDLTRLEERRIESIAEEMDLAVLQEAVELEAAWFIKGNRSSEGLFTELFDNNAECSAAMTEINRINASRWAAAKPSLVADLTGRLVKTADALFAAIQQAEQPISKQVVAALASELELAARWVEWYSVTVTRLIDLTTALKLNEKKLLRAL